MAYSSTALLDLSRPLRNASDLNKFAAIVKGIT